LIPLYITVIELCFLNRKNKIKYILFKKIYLTKFYWVIQYGGQSLVNYDRKRGQHEDRRKSKKNH